MSNKIVFGEDNDLAISNKEKFIADIYLFHRFILTNAKLAMDNERKCFNRKAVKTFNVDQSSNIILSINITKKKNEDMILIYNLRSPNGIDLVKTSQSYKKYEDLLNNIETITEKIKSFVEKKSSNVEEPEIIEEV